MVVKVRTENPRVDGSIPPLGTIYFHSQNYWIFALTPFIFIFIRNAGDRRDLRFSHLSQRRNDGATSIFVPIEHSSGIKPKS